MIEGNGVSSMLPLIVFFYNIPLWKLPWTTQRMKVHGSLQSLVSEAVRGRRTLVYSQIETPLGTTQVLIPVDSGVALESYRIVPYITRSLKLSSQK